MNVAAATHAQFFFRVFEQVCRDGTNQMSLTRLENGTQSRHSEDSAVGSPGASP